MLFKCNQNPPLSTLNTCIKKNKTEGNTVIKKMFYIKHKYSVCKVYISLIMIAAAYTFCNVYLPRGCFSLGELSVRKWSQWIPWMTCELCTSAWTQKLSEKKRDCFSCSKQRKFLHWHTYILVLYFNIIHGSEYCVYKKVKKNPFHY